MREIPLTRGAVALVDDADYNLIVAFDWRLHTAGYACRTIGPGDARTTVLMHRFIIGARLGEQVDHRNGAKLDNQRANLRLCTSAQNSANRAKLSRVRFKGVTWPRNSERAQASIGRTHLGFFDSEVEAARAYDAAAVLLYGEFAHLNFPKSA